ncbi:MAG: hypothetical protein R3344_01305 [Acidobacteriota bacterium]|nr:hypothetical protein [Acidobacteriota bacterium]
MKRRRLHRATLLAAGVYNIIWGGVTTFYPEWFFLVTGMTPPTYPEIFACLGMVLGLYGLLYIHAAIVPPSGFWIVAIGLTGKILGPVGWLLLYLGDKWPASSVLLVLTNDIVWWIPFGVYLFDARGERRSKVAE